MSTLSEVTGSDNGDVEQEEAVSVDDGMDEEEEVIITSDPSFKKQKTKDQRVDKLVDTLMHLIEMVAKQDAFGAARQQRDRIEALEKRLDDALSARAIDKEKLETKFAAAKEAIISKYETRLENTTINYENRISALEARNMALENKVEQLYRELLRQKEY
ncbi:hypothetical protein BGZ73_000239 [Actinomortierella ambigua]|nr:hypothetical protein BGZ73_000239 [Actinomortierella ambigua]